MAKCCKISSSSLYFKMKPQFLGLQYALSLHLCIRHKPDKLLSVAALREEHNQVFLPHNAQVSMQSICGVQVHSLGARRYEGL